MKSNLLTIILAIGFSWKIAINSNTLKAEVQNKNNGASSTRDEKVLRQKAVAQGYELHNAQLDSQDKDKETFLYRVLVKDLATKEAHDFCSADQDGTAKAMLLKGSWDETGKHIRDRNVTVACTSGVLAKCVRWGYKPWTRVGGVSLRNYHQACTRMARADYCGNGTSHTKDGTLIDVYDRLKIQQPNCFIRLKQVK